MLFEAKRAPSTSHGVSGCSNGDRGLKWRLQEDEVEVKG